MFNHTIIVCIIDLLSAAFGISDVEIRENYTRLSASAPDNQNLGAKERPFREAKCDFLDEPAVPLSVVLIQRYSSHVRLG